MRRKSSQFGPYVSVVLIGVQSDERDETLDSPCSGDVAEKKQTKVRVVEMGGDQLVRSGRHQDLSELPSS